MKRLIVAVALGMVACGLVTKHYLVRTPNEVRCVSVVIDPILDQRGYYTSEGCLFFLQQGPTFCGTVTVEEVPSCPRMPAEEKR